jgi:putative ABC transport system permease protein
MTARRGWRRVFRLDVGRGHVERDVDEEIAFHLAMRADTLRAQGERPELAPHRALARFGDLTAIRDELLTIDHHKERAVQRITRLEHVGRDVGYAVRALRHHAAFSAVVVLTLALGIGANSAIFSIVNALILRPIPAAHPEQLVAIGDVRRVNSYSQGSPRTDLYSYPLYRDIRDNNAVFSGLYGNSTAGQLAVRAATPAGGAAPKPDYGVRARYVTANYFDVLGVHAARGRVFAPDEDRAANSGAVVVISDDYWARQFNRDPAAIGRTLTINDVPTAIVGVTPPRFTGDLVAQRTDLWIPVSMEPALAPAHRWLTDRQSSWLLLMGRLKPGATLAQARSQLVPLIQRSIDRGSANAGPDEKIATSQYVNIPIATGARGFSYWRGTYAESLYTLFVAVGLVLLIVCANVANLLLGRATSRSREVGVRLALGAGRGRIIQQLMIESLALAVAGAGLALVVAHWLIVLLLRLGTGGGTLPLDTRLDGTVLAFTGGLSVAAALLFGLAPALGATRVDLASVLRAHSRGITGTWRRFGAGRVLVMLQVALSLMMLVATGMVVRSLHALETSDMGLDRTHLLVTTVNADHLHRSDTALRVMRTQLTARLAQINGVRAVSFSNNGIFSGTESSTTLTVPGFVARSEEDSTSNFDLIGTGYFSAIGARLLRGREFTEADLDHPGHAAVINQSFAAKYFPGADPIGGTILQEGQQLTVVGVSADVHDHDLRAPAGPRLYLPMGSQAGSFFSFEVRTTRDPAALVEPVRRALAAAEPDLQMVATSPLPELTQQSIAQDVLMARFVSAFGVLALLLAAMGLYGIMSYATMRRTGEFGLRMALGASPRDIARMVLRDGLVLIAIGVLGGVPLMAAGMALLQNQLFGVGSFDLFSIAFAVIVLATSAVIAGLLPALRAARVGPLVALQTE